MVSLVKNWEFWSGIPFIGTYIFSWLVTFYSFYTGSIPMRLTTLESGECKAVLYDTFYIRNPFNCIHAAALTNFGEATMGLLALRFAEENNCRCIPSKLEIEFLKKAKGTLVSECKLPHKLKALDQQVDFVTEIFDASGEIVCKVVGKWNISIKKEISKSADSFKAR
jgi:acyl-coenzyme A thioesterase PaaI-like protein